MSDRIKITEALYEQMLDAKVMAALRTDPRYVHAADPEAQSEAEWAISDECDTAIRSRYEVA